MIELLIAGYLVGWLITSVAIYVEARHVRGSRSATHPVVIAFIAGSVWPVLLIGAAEYGSVFAYARYVEARQHHHK